MGIFRFIKNQMDEAQKRAYRRDIESEIKNMLEEYNHADLGVSLSFTDYVIIRKQANDNIRERSQNYRLLIKLLVAFMLLMELCRILRGLST